MFFVEHADLWNLWIGLAFLGFPCFFCHLFDYFTMLCGLLFQLPTPQAATVRGPTAAGQRPSSHNRASDAASARPIPVSLPPRWAFPQTKPQQVSAFLPAPCPMLDGPAAPSHLAEVVSMGFWRLNGTQNCMYTFVKRIKWKRLPKHVVNIF